MTSCNYSLYASQQGDKTKTNCSAGLWFLAPCERHYIPQAATLWEVLLRLSFSKARVRGTVRFSLESAKTVGLNRLGALPQYRLYLFQVEGRYVRPSSYLQFSYIPMNTSFAQEMKQLLEEERTVLQEELESVSSEDVGDHVPGSRAPRFPNYGDDALNANDDSPTEVADYSVNVNVTSALSDRLKQVDDALGRMASGSYGTCARCGEAIAEDRLRVNAAADACIECAKAHTA